MTPGASGMVPRRGARRLRLHSRRWRGEMKGEELRDMQAPLKARYRETPEAAIVTLRATGEIGGDEATCNVEAGRALVEAGLHPATGRDRLKASAGRTLLEVLDACAHVT